MDVRRCTAVAAVWILAAMVADASGQPPTPIRLRANAPSCSQVDLQWTDDASVETGFTIERAGDPPESSWRVVGTTPPIARTFSDTGLSPFTTYYYRVRGGHAADRVSNVVKVKTRHVPPDDAAPTVPGHVTAVTGSACNRIDVSWTESTDVGRAGVKAYTVYGSGGFIRQVDVRDTTAVITGLAPSTPYSFAVSATDYAGNESARSESATARTRATCSGSGGAVRAAAAFSGERSLGSSANCVSFGPDGSTVIAVGQYGNIDYGGGTLMNPVGGVDLAIVKFGDNGRLLWSRIFGGSGDQSPSGMGIDAQGDIYLTGAFENHMELDDFTLDSHGPNPDIFLVKLEAASGRALWARSFGSEGYDQGYALAVDPSGGVVVTGYFTGAVEFGDDGMVETAQGADAFIARFTSDGRHVWSRAIGGPGADYARAIAMDGAGNLSIAGSFEYTVDFGNGHPIESAGSKDIFVASYDLNGVCRWSRGFGGLDDDSGNSIAVDNLGGVVAMGLFVGSIRLDSRTLSSSTTGYPEIVLAKFDTEGNVLWARGCGAGIPQGNSALATDRSGDVLVSVASSATVDLGGGPLAASSEDVVVARLLPDGRHVWSRRFVSLVGRQNSGAIASAPNADVVLVGRIEGTADYDAEVVTANGPVLLRMGP